MRLYFRSISAIIPTSAYAFGYGAVDAAKSLGVIDEEYLPTWSTILWRDPRCNR